MKILVLNCGSSSIKFELYNMDTEEMLFGGVIEKVGIPGSSISFRFAGEKEKVNEDIRDHEQGIKWIIDRMISLGIRPEGIGHRVVHGGESFNSSVLITEEVIAALEENTPLAPLHNPANLTGIMACHKMLPGLPQVGVFDTAFHQTMEEKVFLYGVPYEYYKEKRIRKYGFHGTSHRYVSGRAGEILGRSDAKIITCHLGNGSSITAVEGGESRDTTMGFTPLEGLMMGTRCGDIDPTVVSYLVKEWNYEFDEVLNVFNKRSGLLGISGLSSDLRDIFKAQEKGNHRADLAVKKFCYHVIRYIGAFTAAMNGLDALVFTAGIGENAWKIRENVCEGLTFFGIDMDKAKNRDLPQGEQEISLPGSKVKIFVIPTKEELVIAEDTYEILLDRS